MVHTIQIQEKWATHFDLILSETNEYFSEEEQPVSSLIFSFHFSLPISPGLTMTFSVAMN
jgi:hypothetical protein